MKYMPISFKSDYSLLKSILTIEDIVAYAASHEAKYVGLLDENPYSIMDFLDKCAKKNLKGIFGMIVKIGDYRFYLYIKNYEGYLNIIRINDAINENRLTIDEIVRCNEGLICVLPYDSYKFYNRLKVVMETYLGYDNQRELESAMLICRDVLFINEISYFKKEDEPLLKILYKVADVPYESGENYVLEGSDFDRETIEQFQEECNLEFDYKKRYIPKFCKTEGESKKLLRSLATRGLEKRLHGSVSEVYKERLQYELDVIEKMGFVDYFLIVYDYVKFAKKNDIYVGPGRGSAAGALVSYTLGITDIDPIEYDLLFERFLNPERVTMPDIDIDFEDVRRGEVIDYVRSKYGNDMVSLIIAYGTFGCRQAVRDVGKLFGYDDEMVGKLSKMLDPKKSLKENAGNSEISEFVKQNKLEKMYKISMKLEGLKRNTTIHAAGVVISSVALKTLIPVFDNKSGILTGYTMEYLEKLGLLKMDFLALKNLTTIHNTVRLIYKTRPDFELKSIRLDDAKTYDTVFKKANTDGIFQFETPGMRNFLRKLEPENFDDLVAAIALFRPGPMQNIDEYIARRKGKKTVVYLHRDLESILKPTYGIIIYQEQIMQILSKLGGYSYAEADLVRRAMSKKKKEVMIEERAKFKSRAVAKGYEEDLAENVYDLILRFADYGFNKSHSVAYALIAYQTAYLKTNFSDEFQVNTLNMNLGSEKKTKDVIDEARNKGLRIVRPNVNTSGSEYVIKDGTVILPLTSIKGVTALQSQMIVENQPYEDYFDFLKKTYQKGVNRSCLELLIKAGALEDFDKSKNTLLKNIDAATTYLELIGSLDESLVVKPELEPANEDDEEYPELEIFGFYISGHPAGKYVGGRIVKYRDLSKFMGRRIETVAIVENIKVINTKKGEKMAFAMLNDDSGSIDSVIFPRNNSMIEKIVIGELNKFRATVNKKGDEIQLVLEELLKLEEGSRN